MTSLYSDAEHFVDARPEHPTAFDAAEGSPPARGITRHLTSLPVASLMPGESPRLAGQSEEHIARLAEVDDPLPPILVDPRTMRVIDGTHRLMAARLRGSEMIEVEFFEGSAADAFLHAVKANVTHGYPLSQADRRAACKRIITTHPHLSDRAIAQIAGLSARSVAALRELAGDQATAQARVGRDGRIRPLNNAEGRLRAAELIAQQPDAPLREVARNAGISPSTAGDVRKRLHAGLEPVPHKATHAAEANGNPAIPRPRQDTQPVPTSTGAVAESALQVNTAALLLGKLSRDPSLRQNEAGRRLLVLLRAGSAGARSLRDLSEAIPPHCTTHITQLAREIAQSWLNFAEDVSSS